MAQQQCKLAQRLPAKLDNVLDQFKVGTAAVDRHSLNRTSSLVCSINDIPWRSDKENVVMQPFHYLEAQPGKGFRAQCMHAFNAWLQVPARSMSVIMRVVSMLHTASLLIDDIQDDSRLRRGASVAHDVFGTPQTINSANYVYFCALRDLSALGNPGLIQIYTEELLNLHRGQGMDLYWRDTSTCPTETDYIQMVGNKTGGLFRLAIKLMCAESRPVQNASRYMTLVNSIGVLFQVLDDYRNLTDTLYTQNKGICEDLSEGKFSFPVIHAIQSEPGSSFLIDILRQKTNDDAIKRDAVSYMEERGSLSYTRAVLGRLKEDILRLVDEVDAGEGRSGDLKGALEKLVVDI